jgi:hypothetical protein
VDEARRGKVGDLAAGLFKAAGRAEANMAVEGGAENRGHGITGSGENGQSGRRW